MLAIAAAAVAAAVADDTRPLVVDCKDFNVASDVLCVLVCVRSVGRSVGWPLGLLLGHPIIRMAIWKFRPHYIPARSSRRAGRVAKGTSGILLLRSISQSCRHLLTTSLLFSSNPNDETFITVRHSRSFPLALCIVQNEIIKGLIGMSRSE